MIDENTPEPRPSLLPVVMIGVVMLCGLIAVLPESGKETMGTLIGLVILLCFFWGAVKFARDVVERRRMERRKSNKRE